MTNTLTREASPVWWTTERMRLAGVAGIVGGVVLAAVAIVHNALDFQPGTTAGTVSGMFHVAAYAMMLAALLAADARYRADYGRLGRITAYAIGVSMAALIPVGLLSEFVFGWEWAIGGTVAGIAFLIMHLGATVFGIVLWRRTAAGRLAAGLFIAVVPAIMVVAALAALGVFLTVAAFEAPLYLGFAALGYDVLSGGRIARPHTR
ncbi:MAG: hypothetical protein H0U65_02685 [Rubrobacter sp.]|nr:hypothetical protein [Rubrobacter sp.]